MFKDEVVAELLKNPDRKKVDERGILQSLQSKFRSEKHLTLSNVKNSDCTLLVFHLLNHLIILNKNCLVDA